MVEMHPVHPADGQHVAEMPHLSHRRNEVLFAVIMDVVAGLDLRTTLERIVQGAVALSHAKYGALGILSPDKEVSEFLHVGISDEAVELMGEPPRGRGVLGTLVQHPHPIRLTDLSQHPDSYGFPPNHPPMKTFLGVPVRVRGSVFGNLYLTEKENGKHFTKEDEELVTALAAAAGLAIENARLSEQTQKLAVSEDRNRIARDLHDLVIQSLFATGMSLEAMARNSALPDGFADKLHSAADELDKTIKQIRQSIYELTSSALEVTLRRRVMHEVEAYASLLGSTPSISFHGAVDALTDDRMADHIIAVLRELLSNAMRHAKASLLEVSVQSLDGFIELVVSDNGVGIPESARQSGLKNMAMRAQSLGGTFSLKKREPSGTTATWSIPVKQQ